MSAVEPAHRDGNATLYLGDALAVLAELDTGSEDAILTDPPYSSGGAFRGDRMASTRTKYLDSEAGNADDVPDFTGDNRDSRAYGYWSALWIGEALRVLKPGGVIGVFTDWRQLPTTTDALQAGGAVWRGIVPWFKPASRPQLGRFTNACEYVVWGTNGPRKLGALDNVVLPGFYVESAPSDRKHQTQKPVSVLRSLVQIVRPGETVLDPFMGSGTTGVAALLEGRVFVGVERDQHWLDVARERFRNEVGA